MGKFKGIFAGYERREGKNGEYYIVRFLDEKGKIFECIAKDDFETVVCLERLQEVDFEAEIDVKGPYTRIIFHGC